MINGKIKTKLKFLGLWPSGETSAGSIPARHSDQKSHLSVSPGLDMKMSVGIKHSKEMVIMDRTTKLTKTTTTLFSIKIKTLVVVVSCLLVAPLTRDQGNLNSI